MIKTTNSLIRKLAALSMLIMFFFIHLTAFAQNTTTLSEIKDAATRSKDQSREALVMIFGDVVNNPLAVGSGGGDTILASIFQVANGGLLIVGAFFACYSIFRKVTQTAHDGSVYDKSKHTLWGPIRLVWGLASLVPTANGWCLAQLLMLWAASFMGVGLANLSIDASIDSFADGKSMVAQPAIPSTIKLADELFRINLCMHGVNASLAQAQTSGALVNNDFVQQVNASGDLKEGFTLNNKSFFCGGASLDLEKINRESAHSDSWINHANIDLSTITQAHATSMMNMQRTLSDAAKNFINAYIQRQTDGVTQLPDIEPIIQEAARAYEENVQSAATQSQGNLDDLASKIASQIKESGWWTLGAWYQTFAQANTKMSDSVSGKANVFGPIALGDPGMFNIYKDALTAYMVQQNASLYTPAAGGVTSGNATQIASASDVDKVIGGFFSAPGQTVVNYITTQTGLGGTSATGQTNPVIRMKNLGDYILTAANTSLGLYVAANVYIEVKNGWSIAGAFSGIVNAFSSLGDASEGVLKGLKPFIIMLVVMFYILGGTLSTYVPFVPFIIWFAAAINWLVVVGEAIIAAPLWAMTHLAGEGDGLGNRTTHGYIFLLNVMFRPILMVIGFFLGGAAVIAGGTLLNNLFGIALANVQFDSLTGLVSAIFFIGIYCSMSLNLIHSCFNLIFIVPDQVINWVGGHASATIGRDENDKVNQSIRALSMRLEQMKPNPNKIGGEKGAAGNSSGIRKI